jgi:hypothetical protein
MWPLHRVTYQVGVNHGEQLLQKIGPTVNIAKCVDPDTFGQARLFDRLTGFEKTQHNRRKVRFLVRSEAPAGRSLHATARVKVNVSWTPTAAFDSKLAAQSSEISRLVL